MRNPIGPFDFKMANNNNCSIFSGLPRTDFTGSRNMLSPITTLSEEKDALLQSTSRVTRGEARSRSGLRIKGGRQSAPSPGRPHAQNTKHPDSRSDTWPDRPGDAGIRRSNPATTTGRRPASRPASFLLFRQRLRYRALEGLKELLICQWRALPKYQRCHVD